MKTKVQRIRDLSAKKSRYFAPAFSLYCLLAHMQLSKNSYKKPVEPIGIEPTTSSLQSWRSPN